MGRRSNIVFPRSLSGETNSVAPAPTNKTLDQLPKSDRHSKMMIRKNILTKKSLMA